MLSMFRSWNKVSNGKSASLKIVTLIVATGWRYWYDNMYLLLQYLLI